MRGRADDERSWVNLIIDFPLWPTEAAALDRSSRWLEAARRDQPPRRFLYRRNAYDRLCLEPHRMMRLPRFVVKTSDL
jgi:hypothetical protein